MIRVDSYLTHECNGIKYRIGKVLPYGASIVPHGVNFSIFSKYATSCELVLYKKREKEPYAVIPFPKEFRIGDVYSMIVFDIDFHDDRKELYHRGGLCYNSIFLWRLHRFDYRCQFLEWDSS